MLRFLSENWQLKLMSLGFALVLWFFVMGERRMEAGFTVPLELYNVPEGLVVVNEVPNTIDLRLSGPRAVLADLDEKDVRVSVNLAGLQTGATTISRLDEHLHLPVGVRPLRISPSSFEVRLDRVLEKQVSVRPRLTGKLPPGYQLVAVDVVPAQVTVSGAASELRTLSEVVTERIDLENLPASRELELPLVYRGKYSRIEGTAAVKVQLRVEAHPNGKTTPPTARKSRS